VKTIQHVDLVHFCHSDYGYTDHPTVSQILHRRYIDIAVDAVLATAAGPEESKFCWTAEMTIAVRDWWRQAFPARREEFLRAVASGQLDITALPLNQTPTLNRRQWEKLLHWLPEDLWQQVRPQSAIQNDVNGITRAGAVALLDRGVGRLFMGLNAVSGGAPFPRPSAFWWKMPDGRRMFVWLGEPYYAGLSFFDPIPWRRGPVIEACNTRYRPPRPGEILPADEVSVRKAHGHLIENIRKWEAEGYSHETLLLSMINEWRGDSDPPFPALAEFVAAWQRLGLQPSLRLTTVSTALKKLEKEIGGRIPEYEGEWTDWWANGTASGPRELSASRFAKRAAAAAESPVWGPLDGAGKQTLEDIYEQLCMFDEHTWGHGHSIALPESLAVLGQYNEKSRYSYRPLAQAEFLLSQRIRSRFAEAEEGFYVTNTSKLPWSGWVTMLSSCLRADYRSALDPASGVRTPIEFRPGMRPYERPLDPREFTPENTSATFSDNSPGMAARFWVESLQGGETRRFQLCVGSADLPIDQITEGPQVETDKHQWPTAITWPTMPQPLFLPGIGDFLSVGVRGFAPRWIARDVHLLDDDAQREQKRREVLEEIPAVAVGPATVERNVPTTVYTQALRHPRLLWASRRLEVWNGEPRARLTLRLYRLSSEAPEVFFAAFPLPCAGVLPRTSNGGMPFIPYRDQLPGTCRDLFAIDGWIHYETPQGNWLWVSRDAPQVTFGGQQVLARRKDPPAETNRIMAILFDNRWFTNFVANSHGAMEFQFDLVWKDAAKNPIDAEALADSLVAEPQVLIVPSLKDDPLVARHLYHP
jgi:hypothetical protein